jgi:hypothetical protein
MFFATDVQTTFTLTEFFLGLFEALAFVAAMIWVKVMLYRQRMRTDRTLWFQRELERNEEIARVISRQRGEGAGRPRPEDADAPIGSSSIDGRRVVAQI